MVRAWINEMIAKVTSAELAQDVPGAELLISRHLEHKAEINSRSDAFTDFYATGNALIKQVCIKLKHFVSLISTQKFSYAHFDRMLKTIIKILVVFVFL